MRSEMHHGSTLSMPLLLCTCPTKLKSPEAHRELVGSIAIWVCCLVHEILAECGQAQRALRWISQSPNHLEQTFKLLAQVRHIPHGCKLISGEVALLGSGALVVLLLHFKLINQIKF